MMWWERVNFFAIGIAVAIVAVVVMVVLSSRSEDRRRAEACTKMWTLARTNSDSINIIKQCEYPKQQDVVPIFIPMPYNGGDK